MIYDDDDDEDDDDDDDDDESWRWHSYLAPASWPRLTNWALTVSCSAVAWCKHLHFFCLVSTLILSFYPMSTLTLSFAWCQHLHHFLPDVNTHVIFRLNNIQHTNIHHTRHPPHDDNEDDMHPRPLRNRQWKRNKEQQNRNHHNINAHITSNWMLFFCNVYNVIWSVQMSIKTHLPPGTDQHRKLQGDKTPPPVISNVIKDAIFSYASSSTLHPHQWVSGWVVVSTSEASRLASLLSLSPPRPFSG